MSDDKSTAAATGDRDDTDPRFRQWRDHAREVIQDADSGHVAVYVRSMLPPPGPKESQTTLIQDLERATEGTILVTSRMSRESAA